MFETVVVERIWRTHRAMGSLKDAGRENFQKTSRELPENLEFCEASESAKFERCDVVGIEESGLGTAPWQHFMDHGNCVVPRVSTT